MYYFFMYSSLPSSVNRKIVVVAFIVTIFFTPMAASATPTLPISSTIETVNRYELLNNIIEGLKRLIQDLIIAKQSQLFPAAGSGSGDTPYSLWDTATNPANISNNDTSPIELGLKFKTSVGGYVHGVRFYKGPLNIGTHVGHLWDSTGNLLASVTFAGETDSGWQQALFTNPVAISANTTYVISYYAPGGRYSYSSSYFSGADTVNGPLSALGSGTNGLFKYGTVGVFPNTIFNATNYWVDVMFSLTSDTTSLSSDTTSPSSSSSSNSNPPTVVLTGPSPGTIVSGTIVTISATASDNVGVIGVQFKVDGVNIGKEFITSPYSVSWDTTNTGYTSHTITAVARDTEGNITISSPIIVIVSSATTMMYLTADSSGLSSGHVYYVSPSGNDSNSGNIISPWKTIQGNLSGLLPGDTVNVEPGNYAGFICGWDGPNSGLYSQIAGSPGKQITFQADPTAPVGSVVISTQAPKVNVGIDLEPGCDYITIKGFVIAGAGGIAKYPSRGSGIKVTGNNDQVINNVVKNIDYGFGITSNEANNIDVENNEVFGTGYHGNANYGHGIYLAGLTDGGIVKNNYIHDNTYTGLQFNGDPNIMTHFNIVNNRIINNAGQGINADGLQNSTISNNVIAGYTTFGISIFKIDASGPGINNTIVNNTIVGASGSGASIRIKDASTGNKVHNNILIGGNGYAYRIGSDSFTGLLSDYNAGNKAYQDEGGNSIAWPSTLDTHSIVATASQLFIDSTNGNFHLKAGSPAIDKGTSVGTSITDLDNNSRPLGADFDISAYEYADVNTSTPITATINSSISSNLSTVSISAVAIGNITANSATVSWTTDQLSDSLVQYGATSGAYNNTTTNVNLSPTTTHSIMLSNLSPGTTYHFRVVSKNSAGSTSMSSDGIFITIGSSATTLPSYNASQTYGSNDIYPPATGIGGMGFTLLSPQSSGSPETLFSNRSVILTLACYDGPLSSLTSGCHITLYCTDTTNTCSPDKTYTTPLVISTEGDSYVRYYSIDIGNNAEQPKSEKIAIVSDKSLMPSLPVATYPAPSLIIPSDITNTTMTGIVRNLDIPQDFQFTKTLNFNQKLSDIFYLQQILNQDADTKVAQTGPGSLGNETVRFGPLTKSAVIKFQNKYFNEILAPLNLTNGTGVVGPKTISKLNQLLQKLK